MPRGAFRRVFLRGSFAVKVPRLRFFLMGMRCNRWERETWNVWRPTFGWSNLCPIHFADPLGLVVVMPRAAQPVEQTRVDASIPDDYPMHTAEFKADDYGRLGAAIVALDYGLPWADSVREKRAYYAQMAINRGHRG